MRRFLSTKVVADSLKIHSPIARRAVLEGEWTHGPPSLKTKRAKMAYQSIQGLKEVFPLAYDIIQGEKNRHYAAAEQIKQKLSTESNVETKAQLESELLKHEVRAELNDPEVQFNYKTKQLDLRQPVYRHLAQRDWKEYDMLINIQRLEQLHVIPDTLPTIEPRAAIELQFPGPTNKKVTPGDILPNSVCARPPILNVQEFEEIPDGSFYTVLVVDPDTPDVANDSFTTTLHWAVTNVPLSNIDSSMDMSKADQLVSYLPPHPEKNTPMHRYCVWVFRQATQPGEIRKLNISKDDTSLQRENFNIRDFVTSNMLDPIAAHVWRAKYDLSTPAVREKFGLGPGRVFTRTRL